MGFLFLGTPCIPLEIDAKRRAQHIGIYTRKMRIRLSKGILRMRWFCEHLGDPEMYNGTQISLTKASGNG